MLYAAFATVCPSLLALVSGSRCSSGVVGDCTTLHHKTHNTSLTLARGDEATVAYAWHPWFGRLVVVHDLKTRSSGVFARCRLDGAASGALQEIPAWMLDVAFCSTMQAMAVPVVSLPALKDLAILLTDTRNGKAAPLRGDARVTSRDHHQGDRHAAPPVLCPECRSDSSISSPEAHHQHRRGSALPDQVQRIAGQPDDPPAPRSRRGGRNQVAERPR